MTFNNIKKETYNNPLIPRLFDEIKYSIVKPLLRNFDDIILNYDEERIFQFSNKAIEYEQFRLNLSIPSDSTNHADCFGVYLSISIPQYFKIDILFSPNENNNFKISHLNTSFNLSDLMLNDNNSNINFTDCLNITNQLTELFVTAYKNRQLLIIECIKKFYTKIDEDITFKQIEVKFISPTSIGGNKYLYFYSEQLNIIFLNDAFKTNTKSVINAIENIATSIIHMNSNINPKTVQWKNIFINLNNSGIIFQDIKLTIQTELPRQSLMKKYLFGKKDEEYFIEYSSPDFSTEHHIEKKDVIKIWNNLISTKS